MMPKIGDPPRADDFDELWLTSNEGHGIAYAAATERVRGLVEVVRPMLLADTAPCTGTPYSLNGDDPLTWLGDAVAAEHGLAAPLACLVHRDVALAYHRDTRNPYQCINATVFLRDAMMGGLLVFPDARVALDGDDGYTAVFDGQRLHGMTPLAPKDGTAYRLSITYYCPGEPSTWRLTSTSTAVLV